jgi:hypothetical protein
MMRKHALLAAVMLPLAATGDEGGSRQTFPGFSLVPPDGEAWTLAGRNDRSVLWVRDTGDPEHSVTLAVVAGQAPTSVRSRAELVAFIQRLGRAPPPSPELELVSSTAEPADGPATACARHDARVRDRNAGTILSVAGVACLHPDFPGRMFDVQYTQRGEAGQLEEAFKQEGEAVIASFRFEPAPEDDDWSLAGGR